MEKVEINRLSLLAEGWKSIDELPNKSMKIKWICEDGIIDYGFYNNELKEFLSIDLLSKKPILYYKPL